MLLNPSQTDDRQGAIGLAPVTVDAGLRAYMLRVYGYMSGALAVTGVVALYAVSSGLYQAIANTPFFWLVVLAPLALVFFLSFRIDAISTGTAQAVFWAYAALMGLSLGGIFLMYTGESIARTFFIAAGTFAGISIYGYTTKTDLTRFGSFLIMGLWGLIIASLVSLFWASSALQFAISVIGVVVFVGLTAYDTQRLKELYFADGTAAMGTKTAIIGALTLYLDFINLFLMLLRLFGQRRD